MSDLPVPLERHHRLRINEQYEPLVKFCTEELLIPEGNIFLIGRVLNYDAFWVRVRSGYEFTVSGQELQLYENSPKCAPER